MAAKKKPKPAERARIVYRFEGKKPISQPLVETALTLIRQWVAMEHISVSTPDDVRIRDSARANLRKVAELAVNADIGFLEAQKAGRKGGLGRPKKAETILAKAQGKASITTATIAAIARDTGSTPRTVRDTLTKAGLYTPQKQRAKKNGK